VNRVTPVRVRSGDSAIGMLGRCDLKRSKVCPEAIAAGVGGVGMGQG